MSKPDSARQALADVTSEFMAAGEGGDVNRFRAITAALAIILSDFSRLASQELEGDMEAMKRRLDLWEKETHVNA